MCPLCARADNMSISDITHKTILFVKSNKRALCELTTFRETSLLEVNVDADAS